MIRKFNEEERSLKISSRLSIMDNLSLSNDEPLFDGLKTEKILKEGDCVNLGDFTLSVIETPGHTKGNLSLYSEDLQIVFPGGAAETASVWEPCFVSDYKDYMKSLRKLVKISEEINAKRICFEHNGSLITEDAANYFKELISHTERYKDLIQFFFEKNKGDVENTVKDLKEIYWKNLEGTCSHWIEKAKELNIRAQVKAVVE